MRKLKCEIWGRKLELDVIYDCFSGEEVLQGQVEALNDFIGKFEIVDKILPEVKQYCLKNDGEDIPDQDIPNIFRYIVPKSVYVERPDDGKTHIVALICAYKFDPEHGVAVWFRNERFWKISAGDML